MRNISERDLSVVIPLLAIKIREMAQQLNVLATSSDEADEDQCTEICELQECIEQYTGILDTLRQEYENGLADGINLPSFEQLTRVP